jgi:hypothetical protein
MRYARNRLKKLGKILSICKVKYQAFFITISSKIVIKIWHYFRSWTGISGRI